MSMAINGFSADAPLVLGSVLGVRSFSFYRPRWSEIGSLGSISHTYEWVKGVNTKGRCPCQKNLRVEDFFFEHYSCTKEEYLETHPPDKLPIWARSQEDFDHARADGMHECGCGFYAYFYREWGYLPEFLNPELRGNICYWGVIEGFGETVLGTLGFRTTKAQILALAPATGRQGEPVGSAVDTAIKKRYDVPVYSGLAELTSKFDLSAGNNGSGEMVHSGSPVL